ncbi:MAG: thiamine pyrophosphate-dependent enzyme, partial [Gammaproteobacteria bacterium]
MGLDSDLLHRMLYCMKLQRELEDRIERKLYRQGLIVGGVYVGRGQEAIGVGSAVLAGEEDWLCPSHRDLGAFLVRGMSTRIILAQYLGRAAGPTRGRDGNMHMGDLNLHMIAFISSMAAIVPVAGGAAFALKYRSEPGIVFSYFGDGATSRGDWHEALNMAAVQKLPIVYI